MDKIQIEEKITAQFKNIKEFSEYEIGGLTIGIDGFSGFYGDHASIHVIIMEDEKFDILDEYLFEVRDFLSEDGMHYLWHETLIPFLSKKYHCSKYFFDDYELMSLLADDKEDE